MSLYGFQRTNVLHATLKNRWTKTCRYFTLQNTDKHMDYLFMYYDLVETRAVRCRVVTKIPIWHILRIDGPGIIEDEYANDVYGNRFEAYAETLVPFTFDTSTLRCIILSSTGHVTILTEPFDGNAYNMNSEKEIFDNYTLRGIIIVSLLYIIISFYVHYYKAADLSSDDLPKDDLW